MLRAVSRSLVSRRFLSRFDSGIWGFAWEGDRGERGHPVSSMKLSVSCPCKRDGGEMRVPSDQSIGG